MGEASPQVEASPTAHLNERGIWAVLFLVEMLWLVGIAYALSTIT